MTRPLATINPNAPKAINDRTREMILAFFRAHGYTANVDDVGEATGVVIHPPGSSVKIRARCRTAVMRNGYIEFATWRFDRLPQRTAHNDVDAFFAYCPANSTVYSVDVKHAGPRKVRLRVDPPNVRANSGATSRIRWASEYEIRF